MKRNSIAEGDFDRRYKQSRTEKQVILIDADEVDQRRTRGRLEMYMRSVEEKETKLDCKENKMNESWKLFVFFYEHLFFNEKNILKVYTCLF